MGILIALLLTALVSGCGSWSPQVSGTTGDLYDVAALDASTAWAVGAGGTVLTTTNGGSSWAPIPIGTTENLHGIDVVDDPGGAIIWVVGRNGAMYKKVGSADWIEQFALPTNQEFTTDMFAIDMRDKNAGVTVGADGRIMRTWDGGLNWYTQDKIFITGLPTAVAVTLLDVTWANDSTLWAVGGHGTVVKSTNYGTDWTYEAAPIANSANRGVAFASDQVGWVVGNGGRVLYTSDGGANWQQQTIPTQNVLTGVASPPGYANGTSAWVVGWNGVMVRNTDPSSWVLRSSSTTNRLQAITFPTTQTGWAVGTSGTIIKGTLF